MLPVYGMQAPQAGECFSRLAEGLPVPGVLLYIVVKVAAQVLHIEAGLLRRVVAGHQLLQPGPALDEYDLVLCEPLHPVIPLAESPAAGRA